MVGNTYQGVCECKGSSPVTGIMATFGRMGSLRGESMHMCPPWRQYELERQGDGIVKSEVKLSLAIWSVPQPGKPVRGRHACSAGERELSCENHIHSALRK